MSTHDEWEPIRGLPEALPPGEVLLWQGRPRWQSLALRAMHLKAIGVYFVLLAAWRVVTLLQEGAATGDALLGGLWLLLLACGPILLLGGFAVLAARTTVYSITSRRIVFRIGVALPITLNLPFRVIHAAGLRPHADGTGDIVLSLTPPHRIAYFMLWPHARPWRMKTPEPMLRALPDAAAAAQVLQRALAADAMVPVPAAVSSTPTGARPRGARPSTAAA